MGLTFSLKIKSANGFAPVSVTRETDGKKISQLMTTSIKDEVAVIAGSKICESVFMHNKRVIFQTAMFFQRVAPKDEEYHRKSGGYHYPDDDYVWKHWRVSYDKKSVTAEEMGEHLFDNSSDDVIGNHFNNKTIITWIANEIEDKLFGGGIKLYERQRMIRSIRIENTHPRFAMLEYGGYECGDTKEPSKANYWHGVQNGHSVQAPYGMLRITQAEIESMSMKSLDSYIKQFDNYNRKVTRIPSKSKMDKLRPLITDKTHLSARDIKAITEIYE